MKLTHTNFAYLYKLIFSNQYFASGTGCPTGSQDKSVLLAMRTVQRAADNFLVAESIGTATFKCCSPYQLLCSMFFLQPTIFIAGIQEAADIVKGLNYDHVDKCWMAAYP